MGRDCKAHRRHVTERLLRGLDQTRRLGERLLRGLDQTRGSMPRTKRPACSLSTRDVKRFCQVPERFCGALKSGYGRRVTCGECRLKCFEKRLIEFAKKSVERHNMIVVLWGKPQLQPVHPMMEKFIDLLDDLGQDTIEMAEDGMFDETDVVDRVHDIDFTEWTHADLEFLWKQYEVPILREKTTFSAGGLSAHVRMTRHDAELGKEQ